jgi:hypothetical protein
VWKGVTVAALVEHEQTGPYLSQAEFGQTMFRAITLFAGRAQVRKYYRLKVTDLDVPAWERKRQLDALKQREAELTTQITEIIGLLPLDEQRELLRRYEEEA